MHTEVFLMSESEPLEQIYKRIRKNISSLRKRHNLNQADLANNLHIVQSLVSQFETGKKQPNLEMLNRICDYFKVSLHDMLFMNFSEEQTTGTNEFNHSPSDEIQKCTNRTYYCYYLKVKIGENLSEEESIDCFHVKIGSANGTHTANASVVFPNKKNYSYNAILEVDERYAYLSCHNFKKDFFLHLTFYYYRASGNPSYQGGLGLLQFMDHNYLPVSQYCVISMSRINRGNYRNLANLLKVACSKSSRENKPSAVRFIASAILRLTKKHDEEVFRALKNWKTIN